MFKSYQNTQNTNATLQKTGYILLLVSRLLLGGVFVFSGFVKAIDPLGFSYKIEEYLQSFGGIFESLSVLAFPVAILLSSIELLIGLNYVFRVQLKLNSLLAMLFMLVMTPLTLYIALKNPVPDCGCFGDALIISNWATFYKNLVLITMVISVLIYNKKIHPLFLSRMQWVVACAFFVIGVGLSVYSYRHLPLIDFLPYKVGVNIPAAMVIPENAPTAKFQTNFIYQKNGQQKEFTLENYPKGDSTWVFVDQKTVTISKGYQPPIHDFSIVTKDYGDITEEVLNNSTEYTYLLTMYDLAKTSEDGAKRAEVIYQKALKSGTQFYALTASSDADIQSFKQITGVTYPFCKTDPTTLKTIIRANPGLVLIKKGTIIAKWNWRDFN